MLDSFINVIILYACVIKINPMVDQQFVNQGIITLFIGVGLMSASS